METKDLPIYSFKIKEDGTDTGMVGISLVDQPALESSFQLFSKEKAIEPQYILLKDEKGEYKKEVLGVALRPDMLILRKDDEGDYYYGVFSSETIEGIRNKFHKQKNTSNVNLQHDPDMKIDAYLIESYLIQSKEQLEAVKNFGIEDVELNAWVVRYKIESDELFQKMLDGDLNVNGFSVEVMLERELVQANKNNFNKNDNKIMSKLNKLVQTFKKALEEFEDESTEEKKFESAMIDDSDLTVNWTEVGEPVYYVNEDGSMGDPVEDGEYPLENGNVIVIADGVLSEIRETEPTEDSPEGDMEKTEETSEEKLEESTEETSEEEKLEDKTEEKAEETTEETSDLSKSLSELIPLDSDGSYQLEVYVTDGKVSLGTLYAYTYKDLKLSKLVEEFETLKSDKVDLEKEVEKLQKETVAEPVFDSKNTFSKVADKDTKRENFKSNLDYTLARLGLDNE